MEFLITENSCDIKPKTYKYTEIPEIIRKPRGRPKLGLSSEDIKEKQRQYHKKYFHEYYHKHNDKTHKCPFCDKMLTYDGLRKHIETTKRCIQLREQTYFLLII